MGSSVIIHDHSSRWMIFVGQGSHDQSDKVIKGVRIELG